jgi:hypothetical protein
LAGEYNLAESDGYRAIGESNTIRSDASEAPATTGTEP